MLSNIATITIDVTLSTDDFSLNHIKTYPNPTDNYYVIESIVPLQLKIFDMRGRILKTYALEEGENEIETSFLSKGAYLFYYTFQTKTKSQIVIKK